MKKIQSYILFVALSSVFSACYKDKGNYDYSDINEISFENFNTENGYTVRGGDTLKINAGLKGTQDENASSKKYEYEWSLGLFLKDSVISTERNLDKQITVPPGKYSIQYRVKDIETGVQFQTSAQLTVTSKVYEGYLVMSEVNGQTRLDMLSYNPGDGEFTLLADVLAQMGSTLPAQGKPRQVFCFETEMFFSKTPESYRIYLLTETGTYKIDPETFGYGSLDEIKYEIVGNIAPDFNPGLMAGYLQFGLSPTTIMMEGNNVYRKNYQGGIFPAAPLNVYAGQSTPFKAFPQLTCNDDATVIFDMDKRCFTSVFTGQISASELTEDLGFPTGKDMVYTEDHQATYTAYAIMKDPNTANYHYLRYYPGFSFADMFEPIANATAIDQATHFAVHPQLGYVFYSVGGKLYEYDPFLQQSFLMLDKGAAEITHISFQEFFNPNYDPRYTEWGSLLSVGSYDPSGSEGSNGTLELFTVRDVNRPLLLEHSWTGFGKIASIAYRERT